MKSIIISIAALALAAAPGCIQVVMPAGADCDDADYFAGEAAGEAAASADGCDGGTPYVGVGDDATCYDVGFADAYNDQAADLCGGQ